MDTRHSLRFFRLLVVCLGLSAIIHQPSTARAATIIWNFQNTAGGSLSNKTFTIWPAEIKTNGNAIISVDRIQARTGADALATNTLLAGNYYYQFDGPWTNTAGYIVVGTNASYFAANIWTNLNPALAVTTAYSKAQSDARYIARNSGSGTNLTLAGTNTFTGGINFGGEIRTNWPTGGSGTTYTNTTDPAGVISGGGLGTNLTAYATTTVVAGYGLSVGTNFSSALETNFTTFTVSTGGYTNVQGTYTLFGTLSGSLFWTNHNALVGLSSNGITLDGLPGWAFQTNDGTLKTSTNDAYYWNTNVVNGYPSGTFANGTQVTGSRPTVSFPAFTNAAASSNLVLGALYSYQGPEGSNSTVARVETWGSDTAGRVGGYPFKSFDQVNLFITNATHIALGAGWFSNASGTLGYVPRTSLLPGQTISGKGPGITLVGYSPGSNVRASLIVTNNTAVNNMTIYGAVFGGGNITNISFNNVEMGTTTNIDNLYFGNGTTTAAYDVTLTRVKMRNIWDATFGVATGTFNDCDFATHGGDTNLSGSGGVVHTLYATGVGTTNRLTINGGRYAASGPYSTAGIAQGLVVLETTNCAVQLNGPTFIRASSLPAITNTGGAFNPNINGWFFDVVMSADYNCFTGTGQVQSVQLINVTNGLFFTNYVNANLLTGTVPLARLPSSVVTNGGAYDSGQINSPVISGQTTRILWHLSNNFMFNQDPDIANDFDYLGYPDGTYMMTNNMLIGNANGLTNLASGSINNTSQTNVTLFASTNSSFVNATNTGTLTLITNTAAANVAMTTAGWVGINKTPTVPLDVTGAINLTGNLTSSAGALTAAATATLGLGNRGYFDASTRSNLTVRSGQTGRALASFSETPTGYEALLPGTTISTNGFVFLMQQPNTNGFGGQGGIMGCNGTNWWTLQRDSAGVLTTNKLTLTTWP